VRVIVRLVDVATDRQVWGDSFDGSVNDPFALQDRVVDGVLCGVVSRITDAEIERARGKDPRDVGARDLALQALPLILDANLRSVRGAIAILDRAIDMDPADATAVAFLGYLPCAACELYRHCITARGPGCRSGPFAACGNVGQ
jgi:hypothetical protein